MSTVLSALDRRNAIASTGLPVSGPDPREVLEPDGWRALVERVRAGRLEGLLARYTSEAEVATEEQREEAAELHTSAALLAVRLEQLLLEVASRLEASDIDVRVLKGPAHAHLLYAEPALRSFGDIDLLIRGEQLAETLGLLEADGGRRRYPELRPGYDRRFSKGIAVVLPSGDEIDLHRTLAPGPFGLALDPADLFERQQAFALGGRTLLALDPADQFLHSCYHAVLGRAEPNIVALRDVAQLAARPDLPIATVVERAIGWRGRIVVGAAVTEATDTLGLPPDWPIVEFARRYQPDRTERRWLAGYVGRARTTAAQALASTEALPGWRARGAYAVAVTIPKTRGSILRRWRRGVRQLRAR